MMDELSERPVQFTKPNRQPGTGSRILVVSVVVSSVLLLAVNLNLSLSNLRTTAKIQQLEEKLDTLSAFEQRVGSLLQQFNGGVQSRLEQQSYDLQGWLGEFDGRLGMLESSLRRSADSHETGEQDAVLRALGLDQPLSGAPEPQIVNAPAFLRGDGAEARQRRNPSEPGPASSSYERMETADGKVYFRRVDR